MVGSDTHSWSASASSHSQFTKLRIKYSCVFPCSSQITGFVSILEPMHAANLEPSLPQRGRTRMLVVHVQHLWARVCLLRRSAKTPSRRIPSCFGRSFTRLDVWPCCLCFDMELGLHCSPSFRRQRKSLNWPVPQSAPEELAKTCWPLLSRRAVMPARGRPCRRQARDTITHQEHTWSDSMSPASTHGVLFEDFPSHWNLQFCTVVGSTGWERPRRTFRDSAEGTSHRSRLSKCRTLATSIFGHTLFRNIYSILVFSSSNTMPRHYHIIDFWEGCQRTG